MQVKGAGDLTDSTLGGPHNLVDQVYYFGINDTVNGDYISRKPFNSTVMELYNTWNKYIASKKKNDKTIIARAAIARGQALFNSKQILIREVKGINDDLNINALPGTCSTCHNTPNSGNHSVPMPLDIGISDESRRTPDMPLYTLRNNSTNEIIKTTDPGRALVTGKWKDVGRFKGPVLRAVASRPPYFHDGSAKDLSAVIDFYDNRFSISFTDQEKADLVAFLASL